MIEGGTERSSDLVAEMLLAAALRAQGINQLLHHVQGERCVGPLFGPGELGMDLRGMNGPIEPIEQVFAEFDVEVGRPSEGFVTESGVVAPTIDHDRPSVDQIGGGNPLEISGVRPKLTRNTSRESGPLLYVSGAHRSKLKMHRARC